ncbi:hypothetical protein SCHPADRAFT_907260 [Schizopora paradoxa]|uniref:Uncharacterized protein n=1 Tax=Schizopora paradoxa TaxID=27342 RepID=A0A0H2RE21_9AGAM|nr:hypothetical protein SCHPADRAFT_907260 [Schizopora paradoxa]
MEDQGKQDGATFRNKQDAVGNLSAESLDYDHLHDQSRCPWAYLINIPDVRYGHMSLDDLRLTLHTSQTLEGLLQEALSKISASVQLLNDRFTDAINKTKFCEIPDDILALIFEMVCEGSNDRGVVGLMLVCRRFRQLIVSLPAVWSSIFYDSVSSLEKAKFMASRATAPIIDLLVMVTNKGDDISAMYDLTTSISSRIRDLSLHLTELDIDNLQQASTCLSSLSLPSLTSLVLAVPAVLGRNCTTFIHGWDIPSLRAITLDDVLPEFRPSVAMQIEFCALDVNRTLTQEEDEDYWHTDEIVGFVHSLSAVKEMHMAVRFFDEYTGSSNLSMPSVKHLRLYLQNLEAAMNTSILNIIVFPAITSLDIRLGLPGIEHLEDFLDNLLFHLTDMERSSITDLSLHISREFDDAHNDSRVPFEVLASWCQGFENLKSLELQRNRYQEEGLLTFSGLIDSLKVFNSNERAISSEFLESIPRLWDCTHTRRAVLDMADTPHIPIHGGYMDIAKFT